MTGIVVLGAGGFIGRAVTQAAGARAVPFRSADLDLLDAEAVREALAQHMAGNAVIYCAGVHRQRGDDLATLLDNQRMIEHVIGAMASPPRAFVFLSSVEVYGAPMDLPVTEQTPLQPIHRYAVGKVACELLLQRHCRKAGIPLALVRLPGVYGSGDNGVSIIGRLVAAARGGAPFTLKGDGATRRDYIHVTDVARACIRLADERAEGTINLATGDDRSLGELIALVSDRIGPCNVLPAAAEPGDFDLSFDVDALRRMLPGFTPMPVEDGISLYAEARN